jgi:hypothetical protein
MDHRKQWVRRETDKEKEEIDRVFEERRKLICTEFWMAFIIIIIIIIIIWPYSPLRTFALMYFAPVSPFILTVTFSVHFPSIMNDVSLRNKLSVFPYLSQTPGAENSRQAVNFSAV